MKTQEQEIVEDIRRVARGLGLKTGDQLSRSEYLNNGARFSMYQIYDGGMTWSHYCQKAGFEPKAAESVPDESILNGFWKQREFSAVYRRLQSVRNSI